MPAEAVLTRVVVPDGPWAEDVPPVPAGFDVTVSFGSQDLADEHGDALALLGYRVIRIPPVTAVPLPPAADFLVSLDLIEQHPTYWRSLAGKGARAYDLRMGPAAAAVAEVVAAHTMLVAG
jgi:hypothetical protein